MGHPCIHREDDSVRSLSLSLLATLVLLFANSARADGSSADLDVELGDASKSVMSGQVSLGMERIKGIFSQINPISDRILYRKVGSTYLDILYQIEDTNTETQVLSQLLAAEDGKYDNNVKPWFQYYIGRNYFQQHKYEEAEKFLHVLTGGGSNRITILSPQRFAAIILSKIEFGRNNIEQSAMWMRRAIIGLYCDRCGVRRNH
jgi:hypothetical protein